MDDFFHRQEPDMQQPSGLLAGLLKFDNILVWITRLVLLTEQEQKDAGIYLGEQRYK
jgi:hypothetical protein